MKNNAITITATINAPIKKVWEYWNNPKHISGWAFASDDWEAEGKENDLRVGGTFATTMSAKDKSASFEFGGIYTIVTKNKCIEYEMTDGRHVKIEFETKPEGVHIVETFDPENENPIEMQRDGWLSILYNFKKYTENTK